MGMSIDEDIKTQHECVSKTIDTLWEMAQKNQQLQADYENRLKADMVAMLTELQLEIEELEPPLCHNASRAKGCADKWRVEGLIQQKINKLKGEQE